ncbi:60S ribosomal protein L34 [Cryptosporidium canis]|uniref:60S ribosomal protein L34 n=1 Tax=Cryptosporidium canis TaxID=195482 RepID=A0A9D5DLX3_9CRYT|nr:60S ribosomal protein L34 [Cryptosporidium canis]KAJ1612414.1 60S ribosomal protein L34 [Cryptosporidium canis]KAJ1615185.1 60S ribosomal protein L34 [Cryptosporidium canis]
MSPRVTYRRKCRYNTPSNRVRVVKTPGGRNLIHNIGKVYSRPKCGDCKKPLPGIPACGPYEMKHLKKRERTVARAYGGTKCSTCVRQRILRAFLLEEQKVVKSVIAEKEQQKKNEEKPKASKKSAGSKQTSSKRKQ